MNLSASILITIRPLVNVNFDDDSYDEQLIPYINLGIGRLRELGCGPKEGFLITSGAETFSELLGDTPALMNHVPTFLAQYARANGFDMPNGTQVANAIDRDIAKLEWSIKWECENYE